MPNSEIVVKLAVRLDVSTDFLLLGSQPHSFAPISEKSQSLLNCYERLNNIGQMRLLEQAEEFTQLNKYILSTQTTSDAQPTQKIVPLFHVQGDEQDTDFVRELPVYEVCASAGTGQPIDMSRFENVPVGDEVPLNANFGVPLAGNSMEPAYPDGSIVWVKQQRTLEDGQIGIFYWDGQMYCKQFRKTKNGIALVSLNREYQTILIDDTSELVCYGRVVAVSEPT